MKYFAFRNAESGFEIVPDLRRNGGKDLDWDKGIPQKDGTNTFTIKGTSNRIPFPELNDDE